MIVIIVIGDQHCRGTIAASNIIVCLFTPGPDQYDPQMTPYHHSLAIVVLI